MLTAEENGKPAGNWFYHELKHFCMYRNNTLQQLDRLLDLSVTSLFGCVLLAPVATFVDQLRSLQRE
jgi:hypothetical protein